MLDINPCTFLFFPRDNEVVNLVLKLSLKVFANFRGPNYSDPELIYLTDGASKGVMQILNAIIRGEGDGVTYLPK